jgi:antitoxin VapB
VSLNIKNERVHAMAREAARRTGRTQTGAIQLALEKLLAETEPGRRPEDRRRRIDLVLRDVDLIVTDEMRRVILAEGEALYDGQGLPR